MVLDAALGPVLDQTENEVDSLLRTGWVLESLRMTRIVTLGLPDKSVLPEYPRINV